jgi:CheY-like chemotaxis protein
MSAERPRVLLVDDDPDIHMAVEMTLAPLACELICCQTGAAALDALQRQAPDLVLMDIMLEHPTEGLRIACQMRQDERLKNIPIIFVSSIGESMGQAYAQEVCPVTLVTDNFLEKPLNLAMLRETVRRVLAQKSAPDATGPV